MATDPTRVTDLEATPSLNRSASMVRRRPGRAESDPVLFRRRRRAVEATLSITVPVLLLAAWQFAARNDLIDSRYFPAPTSIWSAGVELARSGDLQEDALASFRRVALGFSSGCAIGVLAGAVLGMSRLMRAAFEPLVYALWTVPKLALLPLLLLIFGIGELPIIVLIATNCFFLMLIPTVAAIISVPSSFREVAGCFEANRWELARHVLFPAMVPQVFVGLRLAAGASILMLVAAEFVQGDTGLGHLIWSSWSLFLTDRMYVGIVVVAVSGALFTMLIGLIGRRLAPWAES